ncbi:hypothetical protein GGS21DRAFT_485863 [Xylaria nigripes]|nr:hypothetical protein GGS21DRAFT_485863 [Xylaria nigripes]
MLVLRRLRQRPANSSFQNASPRAPRQNPHFQKRSQHFQSSKSSPSDPASDTPTTAQTNRISRILDTTSRYLPKRLQTSLQNLRSAPFSHVCAFLILHEVTAIIPVLGLTYTFYTLDWTPTSWIKGSENKEKQDGKLRQEAKRDEGRDGNAPWIAGSARQGGTDAATGDSTSTLLAEEVIDTATGKASIVASEGANGPTKVERNRKFNQYAAQMAAAYAITKFLLVPRIALSLWLTPWLARGLVGFRQGLRRIRS